MSVAKRVKILAPALALATILFWACDTSDPYIPAGQHPASAMTQTQSASAGSKATTVEPTTKTLVLKGAKGKTICMARTNAIGSALAKENSRIAKISSGASASAAKSLASFSDVLPDGAVPSFDFDGTNDPHKKIYDAFLTELKEAKNSAALSKSLAASEAQSAVKNYAPGDTETFWALNPKTLSTFNEKTFILLSSGDNYNVWVDTSDKYYKQDTSAFTTAALDLGTNFINGYGLVSHLYGQPANNIYNASDGQVYGPMATASKTGLKINIMLYDMLEVGKVYGFVYHGDVYHFESGSDYKHGSNEGRFVYIDSQTTIKQPLEAKSTAQHEFSHTISKNQKTLKSGKDWTYWYGELLAMMCEDMMQNYLGISDSEVDGNMSCTPKARLPQANALAWGNGISGEDSLAYASVFQFGAWLSRTFGGAKFIKELSQNAYVDMESVLNAVNAMGQKQYTQESLLQEFANALTVSESGKGLNKDAATYPGNADYTCAYTGADGQTHTYEYPITAINLRDYFYGWCDTTTAKSSDYCSNKSIPFPRPTCTKKPNGRETSPQLPTWVHFCSKAAQFMRISAPMPA